MDVLYKQITAGAKLHATLENSAIVAAAQQ